MRDLLNGFHHAVRQLRKSPGLTTIAILTLALAIGANTTIFSIVDAVMLRPLPYTQPRQLVEVGRTNRGLVEPSGVSYPEFFDWRRQNHTLEHLVSYHDKTFTLTGVARAVQLDGEVVSWDLLPMLGISPELGRGFTQQEEKRGTRVALISHSLWESQFVADRSILGRTISLSGTPYAIIGVMPASFRFPIDQPLKSVWTTLAAGRNGLEDRSGLDIEGGRERERPRFAMVLAGAFAGLALILTVVGLYGVMMYSVSRRTREIGVRLALGARRSTVLRMVLRDAAIHLVTGIAIGLTATVASASLLRTMLYGTGSRNPQVLAPVCIVVALAGLLAAFLPAMRAAAVEPTQALRTD